MSKYRNLIVSSVLVCGGLLAVYSVCSSDSWLTSYNQKTSVTSTFGPIPEPVAEGPCDVDALPAITDPDAMQFETAEKTVDTEGMRPAAKKALAKFESLIEKFGGTVKINSAYRPQAYQAHLRQVWLKWMTELKDNKEPGCRILRSQVEAEFTRHHLLETQHPVPVSDHTRGLAFDAAVTIPKTAVIAKSRKKKIRVTVDYLAKLSGIRRPALLKDPVHFKLAGGKKANA